MEYALDAIIELLNEALALDRKAISILFRDVFVTCNDKLGFAQETRMSCVINKELAISPLGIVNSIVKRLGYDDLLVAAMIDLRCEKGCALPANSELRVGDSCACGAKIVLGDIIKFEEFRLPKENAECHN